MKAKLHRVAIVVKDLDKSIEQYAKLTGATFHKTGDAVAKQAGAIVAAAWDAGIELVMPFPGSDHPTAVELEQFLETRGEGPVAIGMVCDDMERSVEIAGDLGMPQLRPKYVFSQKELEDEFGGVFSRFEEIVLNSTGKLGYTMALNTLEEIEPAPGSKAKNDLLRNRVRDWWKALERADFDAVVDYLHDDVEWHVVGLGNILPGGGVVRGKNTVRTEMLPNLYAGLYQTDSVKFDITAIVAEDPMVFMSFVMNARTNSGKDWKDVNYVSTIKFEGGKIKTIHEFPDTLKAKNVHFPDFEG